MRHGNNTTIDDVLPEFITNITFHKDKTMTANAVDGPHGDYTGRTILGNYSMLRQYELSQFIYNGSVEEDVGIALWRLRK